MSRTGNSKMNWRSWRFWNEEYRTRVLSYLMKRKAIYVIDEKWDNLVILDACRYDTFKELNHIDGILEWRVSGGSETQEFLVHNFGNHPTITDFSDIVYVTANPVVNYSINRSFVPNTFHKVLSVWDEGWDDQLNTVPPERVKDEALKALEKYPGKRLIIHFMQPHFPSLSRKFGDTGIRENRRGVLIGETRPLIDTTVEDLLEDGQVTRDEVLLAYKENLLIVLGCIKNLLPRLPGRTVVTSDHGEMFGDRPSSLYARILYPFRAFGHPAKLHLKELVTVPWLVVAATSPTWRAKLPELSTEAGEQSLADERKVEERLRRLGYL